ncbi:MAG: hypothetical protein NXH97_22760 [Rhodobacteraceae bacterium]|nr:hypothetical protein [Paracoccaceae bacterium]
MSTYQSFDVRAAHRVARDRQSGLSQQSQKSQAPPVAGGEFGGEGREESLHRPEDHLVTAVPAARSAASSWTDQGAGTPDDYAIADLTGLERDMFEERAAIIEFDGDLDREEAERMALRCSWDARVLNDGSTGPF